jgi:hypothetical protein
MNNATTCRLVCLFTKNFRRIHPIPRKNEARNLVINQKILEPIYASVAGPLMVKHNYPLVLRDIFFEFT